MTVEQLNEFIVLVECKNYSIAAESLFISQATLSRHIKSLEEELGQQLIERSYSGVKVTRAGKTLQYLANLIVVAKNSFVEQIENDKRSSSGMVTIAAFKDMSYYHITDLIAKFHSAYPNIKTNLFTYDDHAKVDALLKNTCDFVFSRGMQSMDKSQYDFIRFTRDSMVAVLPSQHPLSPNKSIILNQLRNENFLLQSDNNENTELTLKACRKEGFEPNFQYWGIPREGIFDLVGHGMGVALEMKLPAAFNRSSKIVLVDIVPAVSLDISLFFNTTRLSATAGQFLTFTNAHLKKG